MRLTLGWKQVRGLCAMGALASLVGLTGCPFFVCEGKADCGTGTSTGTGDYVYVSNSASGSTDIDGYEIGTNTLTALPGSPYSVALAPLAMAVSTNDEFLYLATTAGVYMYNIGSTGELTGGTLETTGGGVGAMALSPDGDYLFTMDYLTGTILTEYLLNTSTGALSTQPASFALFTTPSANACGLLGTTPASPSCAIAVSPKDDYVAVALNANGVVILPYVSGSGSGSGVTQTGQTLISALSGQSDFSTVFDNSGNLYVASTDTLTFYNNLSTNPPSSTGSYSGFPAGTQPRSLVLSTSYDNLFSADLGTGDIQQFKASGGIATILSTGSVLGPADVEALGVDRSGTYLLAAGYSGANGLQLLTISSTSGLTAVTGQPTGATTTIPVTLALTH